MNVKAMGWHLILIAMVLWSAAPESRADSPRGYHARPCGFDMNRNGTIGEPADRLVGDGATADPDADGVDEDIYYVDSASGSDTTGDGSPGRPYKTVQKALNVADGPYDGAEDIVCISGTFKEAVTMKRSGVTGYYTRDNFQFPDNPAMLIGWDKDGDGEYPPYDTDDTAVLDGNVGPGKLDMGIRTSAKHSYLEIAHLSITNYGSDAWSECGAMKLFRSGSGSQSHAYVHDVEMSNINRAIPSGSARIVINLWGGPITHIAFINNNVDEYASWFCRGSPPGGNFRFQNNSLKMYATLEAGSGQYAMGWKLWGTHSNVEILDNFLDGNPRAWGYPTKHIYGIAICQCAQNYTVRGNEILDILSSVVHQGDAGSGYCQSRPVDNIVIDRNVIRNTYSGWTWGGNGISIGGGSLPTATVAGVTITNNFISYPQAGACGIRSTTGNDAGNQPGSVTIVGNTISGPWVRGGFFHAISINDDHPYRQQNWVIKNNIVTNVGGGNKNVGVEYAPTNWVANGNVYDGSTGFVWNNSNVSSLASWRSVTGQDADSRVGNPSFVDAANDDFHLDPNDTVARGAGVDITDITGWDIDGDIRDPNNPTAGADVEGAPPDTEPPAILGWASAADHGHGVAEALLAIPDDGSFSEPRSGGIGKLIVLFSEAIDPVSFIPGGVRVAGLDANNLSVDLGGLVIGCALRDGDVIGEVTFTPALPDYAKYVVRVSGARDTAGNGLAGDDDRIVTALCGDVSGDLRVNATDFSRVRAARTRVVDPGTPDQVRADVSADGRVNASDLSRIRARRGHDARAIPGPVLAP